MLSCRPGTFPGILVGCGDPNFAATISTKKQIHMKKILHHLRYLIPGMLVAILMTACETTEGAGRDIQNAGEAIEDAAD